MLTKFSLSNFRCFYDEQYLEIAVFDADKGLHGLTYILGKNNTGKTSVLEALRFRPYTPFDYLRDSDLHTGDAFFFKTYQDGKLVQHLVPLRENTAIIKNLSLNTIDDYIVVPSRRYWSPRVENQNPDLESIRVNDSNNSRLRQLQDSYYNSQVASMLSQIERDDTLYKKACSEIRKVFPDFHSYTTARGDSIELSYNEENGVKHRADFLGDGVVSVMRIVANLLSGAKDTPLIVDEPELSLHPDAKRRLAKLLFDHSAERQIIICTHSPEMIEWEYIEGGAKVNRIVKSGNESKIFHLGDPAKYKAIFKSSKNDWQKPYIFDMAAKEIFFMDNILFLEGHEDMALLRRAGDLSSSINIFGYGVGGYQLFEPCLEMAKDLGVEKAAILIDNGDEETKKKRELATRYPNYKVIQWLRRDIRDKKDRKNGKIIKIGYFTEAGELKQKHKLRDYYKVIKRLNDYFDQ